MIFVRWVISVDHLLSRYVFSNNDLTANNIHKKFSIKCGPLIVGHITPLFLLTKLQCSVVLKLLLNAFLSFVRDFHC